MRLAIARIATWLPERQQHDNLLGSIVPGAYRHLYDPAGNHSRPPTVRRGTMRLYSQPYSTPTAPTGTRTSDMGSAAVALALAGAPDCAGRVDAVFHTHCTLDQQILGSTCLRIAHDHFPHAASHLSVGQLGTAGVPTTLRLAASATGASGRLACVSASDKWLAPMVRHQPGVVTYGDAGAACVVGAAAQVAQPLAVIDAIHTVCRPNPEGVWHGASEQQRRYLLELAAGAIDGLLERVGAAERAFVLCGDGYGAEFAAALQQRCRCSGALLAVDDGAVHLSSAAPLFALERVIAAARPGAPLRALVWTASAAGHAAAMLVTVPSQLPQSHTGARAAKGESA